MLYNEGIEKVDLILFVYMNIKKSISKLIDVLLANMLD